MLEARPKLMRAAVGEDVEAKPDALVAGEAAVPGDPVGESRCQLGAGQRVVEADEMAGMVRRVGKQLEISFNSARAGSLAPVRINEFTPCRRANRLSLYRNLKSGAILNSP